MKKDEKSDLEEYYMIKKDLELPVKVKLYFLIFENALDNTKTGRVAETKSSFSKDLLTAFLNLSAGEKGIYMLHNINFALEQLDSLDKERTKPDSGIDIDEIRNIETSCEMLISTLKINHWTNVSMKLDKNKKSIVITNKKKMVVIDMKNYFVRKSNKYRHSLVLDAISEEISNENKKFTFNFSHNIFSKIYDELIKCVLNCQKEKILSLMVEDSSDSAEEEHCHPNEKNFVFLSSKNINEYLNYKDKIEKQILNQKFDFKNILTIEKLKIEQSSKNSEVFRLENIYEVDSKELKEKFLNALATKNKFISHAQVLEDFSKKYKAVYEKLKVNSRVYEYISIREESISNQEEILFVKGIENVMSRNYIEFMQVKVRTINPCQSKIIIHISIGLSSVITKEAIKMFLFELDEMIYRKEAVLNLELTSIEKDESQESEGTEEAECESSESNGADPAKSVKENNEIDTLMSNNTWMANLNEIVKNSENLETEIIGNLENKVQEGYLNNHYSLLPENQEKYRILMNKHYLFSEWIRMKAGGVLCTDEPSIKIQKDFFKMGLAKFGKSILKGELLKMSLPVAIFRKESHLESIARNFAYSPMLFDKLAEGGDSLERVKAATLLAISVGTLGISLLKPFNPLLGETLQLRIDGCPIYLEQICHHPPVGAYFFQGRNYQLHGQIEPKISFGMNNIKGYSQRPNYLEFDNGKSQIEMIFGRMVIKGLLFGDREFNYEEKIYAYDKTNHIFSEITYGPRKGKEFKSKNDPMDFVYGKIYRLKPEFLEEFNSSMPRIYPSKENIIEELSSFEGIWNDEIRFDGKPYLNYRTQLPHELVHEEFPLPSNSTFRDDIKKLVENNLPESQKEKERLEEVQRRDKRLREKHCH